MYLRPEEVLSPRSHDVEVIEVILDPGEGEMSVARILWDGEERVAVRWNGRNDQPLGNPSSRGHATWTVLGDYLAEGVERMAREAAHQSPNGLVAEYREMASDSEREREAEEWSEGLIADGDTPR